MMKTKTLLAALTASIVLLGCHGNTQRNNAAAMTTTVTAASGTTSALR